MIRQIGGAVTFSALIGGAGKLGTIVETSGGNILAVP